MIFHCLSFEDKIYPLLSLLDELYLSLFFLFFITSLRLYLLSPTDKQSEVIENKLFIFYGPFLQEGPNQKPCKNCLKLGIQYKSFMKIFKQPSSTASTTSCKNKQTKK